MNIKPLLAVAIPLVAAPLSEICRAGSLVPAERPFLFMNKQEIEGARKRWKEPWAKKAFSDSLVAKKRTPTHFGNFFKYLVLGDEAAGKAEMGALMGFPRVDVTKTPPRDDHIENAIRYDIFYDKLTPEQKKKIEDAFRRHIDWLLNDYWRGRKAWRKNPEDKPRNTEYDRISWLPNMLWPKHQGIFMMALALQDEKRIRALFGTERMGFKMWMDDYVADGHFYMEEFGKQYSTFGELLLWCRGCKRLGLDELGFGYVGKAYPRSPLGGKATMKNYVDGWLMIGMPASPTPKGGTPTYDAIDMGDAGGPTMIRGYGPGATEPHTKWTFAHMNGPAPRSLAPIWFELAHQEWPDANYDWVLAQMRMPGQDKYYPTLFFNLDPVDHRKVKPPPATSYVAYDRGFGMLRMQEGPEYWSSDRPVLALQFGMYYVHYAKDSFTFHRYRKYRQDVFARQHHGGPRLQKVVVPFMERYVGPPAGYNDQSVWVNSIRGKNGVVVDGLRCRPVDSGNEGSKHTEIRYQFEDHVKFIAIRAEPHEVKERFDKRRTHVSGDGALYPGVDCERALFLTDEYLFDTFNLVSNVRADDGKTLKPRIYHWNHHPVGTPDKEAPETWQDAGKDTWTFRVKRPGDGPGVMMRVLGEQDTSVFWDLHNGVTTVVLERKKPATAFVALHEPFKGEDLHVESYERIQQTDQGVGVRITGLKKSPVNDRVLVAYASQKDKPVTLADNRESFTFSSHLHIRADRKTVKVIGKLDKMKLDVGKKKPRLLLNGEKRPATVRDGVLVYPAD